MSKTIKPVISVCIVSWKSIELLEGCLASLAVQEISGGAEIIVLDNNSNDGTIEMIRKKFPMVKLMVNKQNVGFGTAHNQIAKEAKGDLLLLLNPDTTLEPNTLAKFYQAERDHPGTIIAPKLQFGDGQLQRSAHRNWPSWFSHFYQFNFLALLLLQHSFKNFDPTLFSVTDHEHKLRPTHVMGAAMLIPKKLFTEVGGFDEQFFLYFEETDICRRLLTRGNEINYNPDIVVTHSLGGSTKEGELGQGSPYYQKSAYYYFWKHHGGNYVRLLWLETLLGLIINWLVLAPILVVLSSSQGRYADKLRIGYRLTCRALDWHYTHLFGGL